MPHQPVFAPQDGPWHVHHEGRTLAVCAVYHAAIAAGRLLHMPDGPSRAEVLSRPSMVFGLLGVDNV